MTTDAILARLEDEKTKALNRALDHIMARDFRPMPPLVEYAPKLNAANQHLHICACGDYYVCTREADKCPVIDPWTCAACAFEQQDQFTTELEQAHANHRKGQ